MDKAFDTVQYRFDDCIFTVERHFNGNTHLNDLLKEYIFERHVISDSEEKLNRIAISADSSLRREGK